MDGKAFWMMGRLNLIILGGEWQIFEYFSHLGEPCDVKKKAEEVDRQLVVLICFNQMCLSFLEGCARTDKHSSTG